MTSNSVNVNGIVCATSDCTVSETVLGVDVLGINHASSKTSWQCGRFIATALINLLFAVSAAFAIGRVGRAHQTTRRSSLPTMRDLYFTAVGGKMNHSPRRATSQPKAVFVAAVLLLVMCGFDSVQATTCAGDATMMSSTVLLCNDVTQMSTEDIVEVTGDLRLSSLSYDITSVTLPNLIVIGGDLYAADVDEATTTLSFPLLANVHGTVCFNYVETETIELPLLQNVSGDVRFYSSSGDHHSLRLPSLQRVGGYFYVRRYASSLDVGNLESVGSYFSLGYNYYLDTVNVSSLQTVGSYLSIYYVPYSSLTELSFASLTRVGSYLSISSHSSILLLSFESLVYVGGYLYLTDNDALSAASFNSLTSIESTTYCGVSGEYENVCVDANNALSSIAFRSLDYDSVDVAVSSGACRSRRVDNIPHLPTKMKMLSTGRCALHRRLRDV